MDALPWRVAFEVPCAEVTLGARRFDIRHRALVMGVLPSVGSEGDALLDEAGRLVTAGADVLDVGTGGPDDGEAAELERVIPVIEALHARFDVPISVGTGWASVLRAAIEAGAVIGNDRSGFADADYLPVAAAGSVAVVVNRDPESLGDQLVPDAVCRSLRARAEHAEAAGIPRDRVLLDAGLDVGTTERQSVELLHAHDRLAALGWPLALSAADERAVGDRHATHALGIALGCRILRARDVKSARRTADVMAAILEARRVA